MAGKRANGEGTLYRRSADGRWLGSIHFGHDARGRPIRKYVSAKTDRETLRKMKALSTTLRPSWITCITPARRRKVFASVARPSAAPRDAPQASDTTLSAALGH
jgi:hypothetical protein